jgi:glycosyltransferase involved in cell wall biosynthesis
MKNELNVAHFTNVIDGRSKSGTARVARELIIEINKNSNFKQTLIHFDEKFAVNDSIYCLENINEIKIPLYQFPIAKHFISFILFFIKYNFKKNKIEFDVMHWHSSRVYPFFFIIPAKKVVITLHDANMRVIPDANTIWTQIFYWNLRIFSKYYDFLIGVSNDACSKLVSIGKFPKSKVACMYLGTRFTELVAIKPENFPANLVNFFLCVSRWQPYKNVETVLHAYSNLILEYPKAPTLVLVGSPVGNYNIPFKIIDDKNLQERVIVIDQVSDFELAYLYDQALVNINPSLYEGFGLPVLEGLSRGCPSIDHVYTSTSEISSIAGIHIDMSLASQLTETLQNIIINPNVISELRSTAHTRSKTFTWEKSLSKLLEIYSSK